MPPKKIYIRLSMQTWRSLGRKEGSRVGGLEGGKGRS